MILLSFIHDRTSARSVYHLNSWHKGRQKWGVHTYTHKHTQSAWRLFLPPLTKCSPTRPLVAPVPPAFVLVFAPTLLMYECCLYPAKTAVAFYCKKEKKKKKKGREQHGCTGRGWVLVAQWPVCTPRRTSPSGVVRTWQTRLSELCARRRRRIWDVSDCSDGLAHRVATLLPMLLLPFQFVSSLTQALQRPPPATSRDCMYLLP